MAVLVVLVMVGVLVISGLTSFAIVKMILSKTWPQVESSTKFLPSTLRARPCEPGIASKKLSSLSYSVSPPKKRRQKVLPPIGFDILSVKKAKLVELK